MRRFLHTLFGSVVVFMCMQILFSAVANGSDAELWVDGAVSNGTIIKGEHTITAESEGAFFCIAVYEDDVLMALSLDGKLTYSFPEEGAVIKLLQWDENMTPIAKTITIKQIKTLPTKEPEITLVYKGSALCVPDEWEDFWDYVVNLTVVTVNGKITEIKDIEGYDARTGKAVNSTNKGYLKNASGVVKDIIRKQSADVDAVSGATCASYAIMDAVTAALKTKPVQEETPTATASPQIADGVYRGSAQCITKNMNYLVDVDVTVNDGKVTYLADRTLKTPMSSKDKELYAKAWDVISAARPDIDKIAEIDAVSGATISSNGIINAIVNAVESKKHTVEIEGEVYAPPGISLYSRIYPIVTVKDGEIKDIKIVPVEDTDTAELGKFTDKIIERQSVRAEYPQGVQDDAFALANLIDQILYGEGVLDDEQ